MSSQETTIEPVKTDVSIEHVDNVKSDLERADRFGSIAKVDPREIALARKLDLRLMPILWVMYFLNFLVRNALVNGKLNNLEKELNMANSEYNTCVSIFFVGYIAGQIPSNMLVTRIKPALYLSGWMFAWAIVCCLGCLVRDYHGMLALRLVLGITEAPFYSGACYLVSLFYTRKETATRLAIFYTGNLLANSFAGLVAAGVFAGLDGVHNLSGWRWLFLIQGILSLGVAVAGFFLLPNAPLQTRWLNEEERQLAHYRVSRDTTEKRADPASAWSGLWAAVKDYRTWVFALMGNLHLSANGFKNFMPTAVETLGFNTTITLVLTCPPYFVGTIVSVLVSHSSGHFNERTWHITASKLLAIAGFAVATGTYNIGARYFAMVLFVATTYGVNNINLAWTSATIGQTNEKRAAAIAIVNTLGNISFIYTPYLWPDSDAPLFRKAMLASIGFSLGVVLCAWVMKVILIRTNKKIKEADSGAVNLYAY